MTWKLDTAVSTVRDLLQDTQDPYRNTDAKVVSALNIALVEARKLRPDLFIPNLASYTPPGLITDDIGNDVDLPIDPMYSTAVVEYVTGFLSMEDDEFAVGGRAVTLLNRFAQKLVGKGA
jgi:hypothetical protein